MVEELKKKKKNLSRGKIIRLFELDIRPGKTDGAIELLHKVTAYNYNI